MVKKKKFRRVTPRSRRKEEIYFLMIFGIIIFSTIFYYSYRQTTSTVPENIPKIYITCQHRINKANYRDCVVVSEQDTVLAEIKIRGAFNALFDKVGYRLRLYERKSLLGMREDDDWQLFAMHLDYTHMRVKLCFELWRRLEPTNPTAILPNSKYVNVYLNNEYIGLFLFTEKNDRKLFGLDRGQINLESSLIFQLKAFSDLRTYNWKVWEQDLPIDDDRTIMNYIMNDLVNFLNNSTESEFFHPSTGIYSIFDKQNLIDFYVFNYFTLHLDFWNKNYFIMRNTYPSKFFLIPWDFDGSLGQWSIETYTGKFNQEKTIREKNVLYDRLLDNDNFRKECKKRWFELREGVWEENNIMDMLFQIYGDIKESMKISLELYDMEGKMEEYVTYLIQWIPDRIEFCDTYFVDL